MSSRPSLDLPTPSRPSRPPAPALFIGPPSHNDSTTSLSAGAAPGTRPNMLRSRSHLSERPITPVLSRQGTTMNIHGNIHANTNSQTPSQGQAQGQDKGAFTPHTQLFSNDTTEQQPPLPPRPSATAPTQARVEATWSEMQSTLSEVELSAFSATQLFGQKHADALSRLREAQIGLARSWGRGEDDDPIDKEREKEKGAAGGNGGKKEGDKTEKIAVQHFAPDSKPSTTNASSRDPSDPSHSSTEPPDLPSDPDSSSDILLARQRREANDRYFERVNRGVLDVVGRLEEVARAMKGVERESKELWGEEGDTESLGTVGTVGTGVEDV